MAFARIPRRRGKCGHCGNKGMCSCQERLNIQMSGPLGPKNCTTVCGAKGKEPCGAKARGGKCPCPFC